MKVGEFQYLRTGGSDDSAVYNDSSFRWSGVVFHIVALLRSKTGENLPAFGTKYCKKVKKLPPEVQGDLSKEKEVLALEAADAGELWCLKVDGEGWNWKEKNGAKPVDLIQSIVIWLQGFETTDKAHSAEAFYVEVITNTVK